MRTLSFKLAEFEGPLDLILHLLSKHKLDILDIDISALLEQYMETIRGWREKNLDIASEFLEMASRLVYMKTVSLLPKHTEESDKLREELAGQLIEYQLCRLAAQQLGARATLYDRLVRPPMEMEIDPTYTRTHSADILLAALGDALGRGARRLPPPRESFDSLVSRPVVSVTSRIFTLLRTLRRSGQVPLRGLFSPQEGRSGMVATFLALLELVKNGKVRVENDAVTLNGRRAGARTETEKVV